MSKIVKGWVIFLKVVLEDAEVMSGLCVVLSVRLICLVFPGGLRA